ncbi:MAG: 4-alpha-glucanotransferase [Anaerorhabdus sp.]
MEKQVREAGVLLPLFSLPGTMGIGDMGKCAYDWVDILCDSGASSWQILPLHPVGYGNSPYQTYSAFAGDEIYICLEDLFKYLKIEKSILSVKSNSVNYDMVRDEKSKLLKEAFSYFKENVVYQAFLKEAFWLKDYAQFMALKKLNDNKSWIEWERDDYDKNEVQYQMFIQFIFNQQWISLRKYANKKGIKIIGDIPIYLSHDSADVYYNRDEFLINKDNELEVVAGVPPDYFSEEGQLWGNPIYDWDKMKSNNYSMWINRLKWSMRLFDIIRIDHFRAFDTYWAIEKGSLTAKNGQWMFGPSNHFFDVVYQELPHINIIAEDLGDLREEVLKLRDDYHMMGMQIIQFSLKHDEIIRDKKMKRNLLIYTGTHDNEVMADWYDRNSFIKKLQVRWDLFKRGIKDKNLIDKINHYTLSLNADWAILPLQDIIQAKNSRINCPSTLGSPNWEWKLSDLDSIKDSMKKLKFWIRNTNRNNKSF